MSAGDCQRPIGVFDSGVGGLTVLRAIRREMPRESLVYLGDTARVPYGTRSHRTVRRYALQAVSHLVEHDVKMLVVACNTVSAVALEDLRQEFESLPIIGVVEPAADAAVSLGKRRSHLVLGTEGTVERGAYADAIRARDSEAHVTQVACSLLVALAEEGWTRGGIVDAIISAYLDPVLRRREESWPDSVILGCTHFGLLEPAIRSRLGAGIPFIDTSTTAAAAVRAALDRSASAAEGGSGGLRLLATDHPERFARVGRAFLGDSLSESKIEWIDL